MTTPTVRPLVWDDGFAHTPLGLFYYLERVPDGWVLERHEGASTTKSWWLTKAAAKAAAQADYTARVLSALEPIPVNEELRKAVADIGKRARGDSRFPRTFDECISDLGWIDDECRRVAALASVAPKGGE